MEALLFVAPGPVTLARLAQALEATPKQLEQALEALGQTYENRSLRIQRHKNGYQLTTSPDRVADVERFLQIERRTHLTGAALEVLAIIAYQQPATKPFIDSIRGVGSDSPLQTLMRYGLVEEVGRADTPGRPILYATTPYFLQFFGVNSMEELPPIPLGEAEASQILNPPDDSEKAEGAGA